MGFTRKHSKVMNLANFEFFSSFFSFCLQVAIAIFNAVYGTILDAGLAKVTYQLRNHQTNLAQYIYNWVYLIRAQTVLSFVLGVPCFLVVMQLKWVQLS